MVLIPPGHTSIPKGDTRKELKIKDKIKDFEFTDDMADDEVREIIINGFKLLHGFSYVEKVQKGNELKKCKHQNLDGKDVIDLYNRGSVYLRENPSMVFNTIIHA